MKTPAPRNQAADDPATPTRAQVEPVASSDVGATEVGFETFPPPPTKPSAQTVATSSPAAGTRIGPYELISQLGEGGMGAVWKARHTHLDRLVAIKLLAPKLVSNAGAIARFYREMKLAGRVAHPNVVHATDAGKAAGVHYLAMEFVQGTDLHVLVQKRGPLPPQQAAKAVRQAALGMASAHEIGLIHRDIKPQNLLLSKGGQVKVLDLGLARLAEEADVEAGQSGLTGAGQIMGTPDYMAPEQWENTHGVGPAADLYALGCTLFFLLTGKPPFGGEKYGTAIRKMAGHSFEPPPDLAAACPSAPLELCQIYQRLLAKKPEDRVGSATELATLLLPFTVKGKEASPTETHRPESGVHVAPERPGQAVESPLSDFLKTMEHTSSTVVLSSLAKPPKTVALPAWPRNRAAIGGIFLGGVVMLGLVIASFLSTGDEPNRPADETIGNGVAAGTESSAVDRGNLLRNAGFEDSSTSLPGWTKHTRVDDAYECSVDTQLEQTIAGRAALRISAEAPNHIAGLQTVRVKPHTDYQLSGYVKTAGVIATDENEGGASLAIWETNTRSRPLTGYQPWTVVRCTFYSGDRTEVQVGAELGSAFASATGTAWFDELKFEEVSSSLSMREPHIASDQSGAMFPWSLGRLSPSTRSPNESRVAPATLGWTAGPTDALPGLVPRPAELPGVGRWQLDTRQPRSRVVSFDLSPDGQLLALGTAAGVVRLHDPETFALIRVMPQLNAQITCMRWSRTGDLLALGLRSGEIGVFSQSGRLIHRLEGHASPVADLDWSPDGRLVSCEEGHFQKIQLWNADGTLGPASVADKGCTSVRFDTQGTRFVTSEVDETSTRFRIFSSDGRLMSSLSQPDGNGRALWHSDNQRLVAFGFEEGPLRLLDLAGGPPTVASKLKTGEPMGRVSQHLAWNRAGDRLAVPHQSGVAIFDAELQPVAQSTDRTEASIAVWSLAGDRLWAWKSTFPSQLTLVDAQAETIRTESWTATPIWFDLAANASSDIDPESVSISVSSDEQVALFTAGGRLANTMQMEARQSLAWQPSGDLLALRGYNRVRVFRGDQQVWAAAVAGEGQVAWSPNGEFLAVGSDAVPARLFGADGRAMTALGDNIGIIVTWTPDGRITVSRSNDSALTFTTAGRLSETWQSEAADLVNDLDWSPDRRWLAMAMNHRVQLFDTSRGNQRSLPMGMFGAQATDWSSDSQWVASAGPHAIQIVSPLDESQKQFRVHSENGLDVDWHSGPLLLSLGADNRLCLVNTDTDLVEWVSVGLPTVDQTFRALTVNTAGEIIFAEEIDIEQELVYTIENEDGSLALLKPSEFRDRVGSTAAAAK